MTAGDSGFEVFLVVGLIGAFLTAAYMTRCVYLTFFGEYRGHGHPHESEKAITIPLIILAVMSVLAGFLNAAPLDIEKFKEWVEPTVAVPDPRPLRVQLPARRALGGDRRDRHRRRRRSSTSSDEQAGALKGLTERNALARAGYTLLEHKYYLDDLYEKVIVGSIKGPIARGVYWFNQNVIDGVVNGVGRGTQRARPLRLRRRSTRRWSTARSTASPRSPARPVACSATCSRAACSGTHCSCSRRWGCSASPCSSPTSSSQIRGESFRWTGSTTGH